MNCPHCNKPVTLVKGGASSSQGAPPSGSPADMDFIRQLDSSGFALNDFEAKFVADAMDRSRKYKEVRFSEKQLGVVNKMREKYEAQLEGNEPPPRQPAPRSDAPKPPESSEEPPSDDFPF